MGATNLELQRNVRLEPGQYALPGTYDIPDNVTEVGIEFTRNNWPDSGGNPIFEAFLEISLDGGKTFPRERQIYVSAVGGVQLGKFGNVITRERSTQTIPDGTGRKARVRYNINDSFRTTVKVQMISPD